MSHSASKIWFLVFVLGCMGAAKGMAATPSVGKASEITGTVLVTHDGEKKSSPLAMGSPVFLKDVVETKKEGSVKLLFLDSTSLVLREKTKIVVSEFLFDPKNRQRQAAFNILSGKVKASIEKSFNKSNSKTELRTTTAVVGVRGTEIALEVLKAKTIVYCLTGLIEVFNVDFPSQIVMVAAGTLTDVVVGLVPSLPIPIPREVLDEIESQFGFPTSVESLQQRGLDELRSRLPF